MLPQRTAPESTVAATLARRGLSRRGFLKLGAALAAGLALPADAARAIVRGLERAPRPRLVWLAFQGCTGCTESFTRCADPTAESLILQAASLDFHPTLQAAAGRQADDALNDALSRPGYVLVVEGAVPTRAGYATTSGGDDLALLRRAARGAELVLAVGTCAAFGGLPAAAPNPTGARSVESALPADADRERVVNLPGCPPVPAVIGGTLAHWLAYRRPPSSDSLGRPLAWYGETVHDRCSRRRAFDERRYARRFDDRTARAGGCLLQLGCKGPHVRNACSRVGWNAIRTYPMQAGHGCIGCSEPGFWDKGGIYEFVPPRRRGGRGRFDSTGRGA
jgi:hydrogenase small subunit